MPGFWFGILLIILFAVKLQWLPVSGRIGFAFEVPPITRLYLVDSLLQGRFDAFWDALRHIILPAITLGLPMAAIVMRVTRTSMLEVLSKDYITFAEAQGLARRTILFHHALKNALIPTVTVAALETGSLLGGNMVVETVFGWPGLGRLVVESIFARNYPLVQAAVLFYALTYVLLNFIADILYTVLNPRIRM
jgi:peptide/nickel transport system permease protein